MTSGMHHRAGFVRIPSLCRPWVILLTGLLLVIMAIAGVCWVVGGMLIAPCKRTIGRLPADLVGESVIFNNSSGENIAAWFLPGMRSHGAVLLLHGVRGSRLDMLDRARFLSRDGFSVLLIDFTGHGESGRDYISFGHHEAGDVDAAVTYLAQRTPGERIGVVACSMGAAAAVLASSRDRMHAMILESMYPTIVDAISDRIEHRLGNWSRFLTPFLTVQMRPRLGFGADQLRPIDAVTNLHMPKLFIAGGADPLTPFTESEYIYALASEPKDF